MKYEIKYRRMEMNSESCFVEIHKRNSEESSYPNLFIKLFVQMEKL